MPTRADKRVHISSHHSVVQSLTYNLLSKRSQQFQFFVLTVRFKGYIVFRMIMMRSRLGLFTLWNKRRMDVLGLTAGSCQPRRGPGTSLTCPHPRVSVHYWNKRRSHTVTL